MVTWYSVDTQPEQARLLLAWDDAPIENLETCAMLLGVARLQVLEYAPEVDLPTDLAVVLLRYGAVDRLADVLALLGEAVNNPPFNYVYAQLQQAKNLHNAGTVNSSGDIGEGGFTFTPRPLDRTVKQIIRPVDGKPHVL